MRRVQDVFLTILLIAGTATAQTQAPASVPVKAPEPASAAGTAGTPAATGTAGPASVPNTLEQRLAACAICHGKQGEGARKNEYYPRLAGKPTEYLYNQLIAFREKRRSSSPVMTYMVGALSDNYLHEIAAY